MLERPCSCGCSSDTLNDLVGQPLSQLLCPSFDDVRFQLQMSQISIQWRLQRSQIQSINFKPSYCSLDLERWNSYELIFDLSLISKLVERVTEKPFISGSSAQLLPAKQSVCLKSHSVDNAILSVHNSLKCAIDVVRVTPLMLLNLCSAFDTVDHPIPLSVLHSGFYLSCNSLSRFDSYFSGRAQSLHVSHISSVNLQCSTGAVLGPLEFVTYTEDPGDTFKLHVIGFHWFADDIRIQHSMHPHTIHEIKTKTSHRISDVALWRSSTRLQSNTDRTELIWSGLIWLKDKS